MRSNVWMLALLLGGVALYACACTSSRRPSSPANSSGSGDPDDSRQVQQQHKAAVIESTPFHEILPGKDGKVHKTEEEWRALLSPEQFAILRQKGTELAFSGAYWNDHRHGVFRCAACGQVLFRSDTKFESGTGWPSFYQPATPGAVSQNKDSSLGMERDEVTCSRCGGHLGHVFDDGPPPTGLRYCINSAALRFEEEPSSAPAKQQ